MDIQKFIESRKEDIQAVTQWYDELYDQKFAKYFKKQRELYKQMDYSSNPISDADLEWILTELPMNLFDVSEVLNEVRLQLEVIKMKKTEKRNNIIRSSSEKQEDKKKLEADTFTLEDDIAISVLTTLIKRVESEVSFSRELIMGAKKIWSGRVSAYSVNPVVPSEIPEYEPGRSTTGKRPSW